MCRLSACVGSLVVLLAGAPSHATLHDRGNGHVYDDVLDVTWLQDANLAASDTLGVIGAFGGNGRMPYVTALAFIAAMNEQRYLGFDDWRLPAANPVDGGDELDLGYSDDGSTDQGYNIAAPGGAFPDSTANELARLYFDGLDNLASVAPNGVFRSGTEGVDWGLVHTGADGVSFQNVQASVYWTARVVTVEDAMSFSTRFGVQYAASML